MVGVGEQRGDEGAALRDRKRCHMAERRMIVKIDPARLRLERQQLGAGRQQREGGAVLRVVVLPGGPLRSEESQSQGKEAGNEIAAGRRQGSAASRHPVLPIMSKTKQSGRR